MSSLLIDQNAEERREISVAILFSVLAHLLLAALVIGILAMGGGIHFSKPKEEPAPVEMVFVNPQNTEPVYVATSNEQETDKAPENTSFESDKNTKAASALEAQGKLPVPTMNGSNDQALEFEDRKFSVGAEPKQAAPPAPPAKPQQETPAQPETQQTAQEQKIEKKTEPDTQLNGIALLEPPVNKSVREIKPIRPATAVAPSQSALPAYQ
ncbi:MAG: hypothetical protein ABIP97_00880, partial [Chthoniobacterales bacterium]